MERQALLLIDVQREYFDLASPLHIPDGPAVLDRLVVALAAARSAGLPVIHVRHEESGGIGVFEPGSPNVEIMADVAPLPGEPVVLKHLPGAFDATDLEGQRIRHDPHGKSAHYGLGRQSRAGTGHS